MEKKKATGSLVPQQELSDLIYTIRGQQVMLDRDLAKLYGVSTGRLNEQVNRNLTRFPVDFMFQLNNQELTNLISHFAISSWGGIRKMPYAFTENGVAMLSSVLRSKTAIEVNIRIMRAFTAARHLISTNSQLTQRVSNIEYTLIETTKRVDETDRKVDAVFEKLEAYEPQKQKVFYDGQIFDAYLFVTELIKKASQRVVLIDNYVDATVLSMLDKRNPSASATIYTQKITQQLQLDLDKHNSQYKPVCVKEFNKAHDRFLIVDNDVYHIGASLKDLGKKWFAFSLLKDTAPEELLSKIQHPEGKG